MGEALKTPPLADRDIDCIRFGDSLSEPTTRVAAADMQGGEVRMCLTDMNVRPDAAGDCKSPASARLLLTVVVPVYDECRTVTVLLERLMAKQIEGIDKEVVIVESNSTDGSREAVLRFKGEPGVRVVLQSQPRGKGHAVREGLCHALGDIVLIQDADLEYDIDDYDRLLEPLRSARHAVVLGSRHAGGMMRVFADQWFLGLVCNVGHWFFTGLFNLLYRQSLRDPWTMYKVFRRDCLEGIRLECNRFDFDVELLAKLLRKGYVPIEIPIRYHSRSFHEGKKIRLFRDPFTWLWACVKYRIVSPHDQNSLF